MWVVPDTLVPALLLQILVVGYTPGPANIYALTMAIRHGRRKSLRMWAGLAVGASIAVCVVAVLTHFLGEALGDYVVYLKYFGAAYLVYLAYKVWKSGASSDKDGDCTFLSGMLMQMTNAKILLFELSVFSTFVLPYSHNLKDLFPVAALLLVAGPGANLVWLIVGSYLSALFTRYYRQVDLVSAIAIVLCAVYILVS